MVPMLHYVGKSHAMYVEYVFYRALVMYFSPSLTIAVKPYRVQRVLQMKERVLLVHVSQPNAMSCTTFKYVTYFSNRIALTQHYLLFWPYTSSCVLILSVCLSPPGKR